MEIERVFMQKRHSAFKVNIDLDPMYHRWVFYNFRIFFCSASSFIKFIVILLFAV